MGLIGPRAAELLNEVDLSAVGLMIREGRNSFEILLPADHGPQLWDFLIEAGAPYELASSRARRARPPRCRKSILQISPRGCRARRRPRRGAGTPPPWTAGLPGTPPPATDEPGTPPPERAPMDMRMAREVVMAAASRAGHPLARYPG